MATVLGVVCCILFVAFIIFALRQGMSVPPDPEKKPPSDLGGGGDGH